MPGRRKQKAPKVRPHYEDDELRLHVAIYLAGLPDDHPAVEVWNRDRGIHEIVRAFPEGEERTACWAVLRPHWEAWETRLRRHTGNLKREYPGPVLPEYLPKE